MVLTLSEIDMKAQSCASEGVETVRRRRSPLDVFGRAIASFSDCRTWHEITPRGISGIFFGLPADVAGARYLYEKIEEAFETETAEFKRSAKLYDQHPSAKRRSATASPLRDDGGGPFLVRPATSAYAEIGSG